jgi:hypothetical protein
MSLTGHGTTPQVSLYLDTRHYCVVLVHTALKRTGLCSNRVIFLKFCNFNFQTVNLRLRNEYSDFAATPIRYSQYKEEVP